MRLFNIRGFNIRGFNIGTYKTLVKLWLNTLWLNTQSPSTAPTPMIEVGLGIQAGLKRPYISITTIKCLSECDLRIMVTYKFYIP